MRKKPVYFDEVLVIIIAMAISAIIYLYANK